MGSAECRIAPGACLQCLPVVGTALLCCTGGLRQGQHGVGEGLPLITALAPSVCEQGSQAPSSWMLVILSNILSAAFEF